MNFAIDDSTSHSPAPAAATHPLYIPAAAFIINHMVKCHSNHLNAVFSALADPTRRAILARLAAGETTVGDLAEPFPISLPAVSKHLSVLAAAGLVSRERRGRLRPCRLNPAAMKEAADWIEQTRRFWDARLDSLAQYLETTQRESQPSAEEDPHGKSRPKP